MDITLAEAAGSAADAGQRLAHLADDAVVAVRVAVLALAEDAGAGDEGVGAGGLDLGDVVDLDAAVDLQADVAAAGIDQLARLAQLVQRDGMKLWPPKPGLTDISRIMSTLSSTYSR
jgi:hypothetical protein